MTKRLRNLLSSTASLAIAASLFITAPFDIRVDSETAAVSFESAVALAKDRDRDDDDDDDDDRDDDRSGKGGRDRDRDRSDKGGDRDRDDDRSGKSRDRDDDNDDDDNSGRGNSRDDRSDRDDDDDDDRGRGRGRGRGGKDYDDDDDNGVEVTFSDGSRIEIENGRFERKDASGRTVEERPARRSDYAKLQQAGTASGSSKKTTGGSGRVAGNGKFRGGGTVAKAESEGGKIEVTYTDGWKEEIENGRYELKDAQNRTVVERRARQSDVARLSQAFR